MSAAVTDNCGEIIKNQSPVETKEKSLDLLVGTPKELTKDSPEAPDKAEKDGGEIDVHVDSGVVENLARGVLNEHADDLRKFQATLTDLTKNQRLLIDTVQQENARFAEMQELYNVEDMVAYLVMFRDMFLISDVI